LTAVFGPPAGAESDRQLIRRRHCLSLILANGHPAGNCNSGESLALPRRPAARDTRCPPSGERLTIRIVRGPARDPESAKSLILEDPGIIENGFRILDAHLRAGRGGLIDLLAVDSQGDFVLLELEREGEEDLLRRVRDHHAWVSLQVPFLRRLYGAGPVSPFRPPRAVVLAESFSAQFVETSRDQGLPLTLLHYRILLSADRPMLYVESVESVEPAPPLCAEPELENLVLGPDRLTPEEWEEFYGFEQRRLAAEGRERVEQ